MTQTVYADPLAGIAAYLRANVGSMLDQYTVGDGVRVPAVFRPKLPENVDSSMPMTCIVVRPGGAGGNKLFSAGRLPVRDPAIELVCYGTDDLIAYQIANASCTQLRMLTQSVWENCKLYWAHVTGGPVPLPDPATLWSAYWVGLQVMYAVVATAGN